MYRHVMCYPMFPVLCLSDNLSKNSCISYYSTGVGVNGWATRPRARPLFEASTLVGVAISILSNSYFVGMAH